MQNYNTANANTQLKNRVCTWNLQHSCICRPCDSQVETKSIYIGYG